MNRNYINPGEPYTAEVVDMVSPVPRYSLRRSGRLSS